MTPRRRIIPIFVPHAGCPNDCVFCNQKRISGSLIPATAETVTETLFSLQPGSGYELAFYGGSFTAIPAEQQEQLLGAVIPFRENGTIASIRLSTRPDAVDEEVLCRLKQFGVETVELGAQSMNDEVLLRSGRGHTPQDTRHAARMVKAAGFRLILQMMTGLPSSTPERDLETARELIGLRPDGVRIYPTVIIKETALEMLWHRGEYREHTVEDAVNICAELFPLFESAGIPVIRLGLNPTDELSGGAAVGGAYHPALGELVRSRILLNKARELLKKENASGDVVLGVVPGRISAMTGQHRCNVDTLMREFPLRSLRIQPAETLENEIILTVFQ